MALNWSKRVRWHFSSLEKLNLFPKWPKMFGNDVNFVFKLVSVSVPSELGFNYQPESVNPKLFTDYKPTSLPSPNHSTRNRKVLFRSRRIEKVNKLVNLKPSTHFCVSICCRVITNFELSAQHRIPEPSLFAGSKHFWIENERKTTSDVIAINDWLRLQTYASLPSRDPRRSRT